LIEVRRATSPAEVAAALDLRERVFCGEQGVSLEADRDGLDPAALHIVALEDGRVVGTCRLLFNEDGARLGRMAVDARLRGQGIGASVLAQAEREARGAGAARITLHAQVVATPLYERAGFEVAGDEYLDEGIPHVPMEKSLA
jgi:putative N-acetyltransferase (TIGR04045 family)